MQNPNKEEARTFRLLYAVKPHGGIRGEPQTKSGGQSRKPATWSPTTNPNFFLLRTKRHTHAVNQTLELRYAASATISSD